MVSMVRAPIFPSRETLGRCFSAQSFFPKCTCNEAGRNIAPTAAKFVAGQENSLSWTVDLKQR
jgi:hypothetical protein